MNAYIQTHATRPDGSRDSFARLAGHYPAPDVSSDYDKSVIFAAIEKGRRTRRERGAA